MNVRIAVWLISILAAFGSGCSKDNPVSVPDLPLPPTANGTWFASNGSVLALTLKLSQDDNNVSGSGIIQSFNSFGDSLTASGGVSGTNNYPVVALTFYVTGYQPIAITGEFMSASTMNVKLNQSGFNNAPLVFNKE
jgi:hypothetical protein